MTCKDCIHERACFTYSGGMVRTTSMGDKAETKCGLFKNKSDYAEVKHGEWIIVNDRDFEQVDAKCSICGYTDVFDETGFYKYCPECGAKMAGSNSSIKEQVQSVKQLGDKMGYGHLMALASALWRKKLCDEQGERYKSGAFIAVVDCVVEPEHLRKMKAELELYDYIVKSVLEVNENA